MSNLWIKMRNISRKTFTMPQQRKSYIHCTQEKMELLRRIKGQRAAVINYDDLAKNME